MGEKEFSSVVLKCGILSKKEICDLMRYFNSSGGFCETKRAWKISRFHSLATRWRYSGEWREFLGLTVDKNIKLRAIRLFGSDNSEYSVTLDMILDSDSYENTVCVAFKTGQFSSKHMQCVIGDYQGFEIEFEPSVALKANTLYRIGASITGPPSWYGQGGVSSVESLGVKFSFWNIGVGRTTVLKGQFAEFVFALD